MVRDNRRIAAPDSCVSPSSLTEQKVLENLLDSNERRSDGRLAHDNRSTSLKVGIVPSVTGSAYLEFGDTKVMCSVNGPRDVTSKNDSSTKGQLFCEFKYASFACKDRQSYMPSSEELAISKQIQDALEPCILLHKFPKSRLDVIIFVLENDGNAISAAITCAGAALSHAGVEMYDIPVGCALIKCGSSFFVDPTADEEAYAEVNADCAKITFAMMIEYKNQMVYMDSCGSINRDSLTEAIKLLHSTCYLIFDFVRYCLKDYAMKKSAIEKKVSATGSDKSALHLKMFNPQKYMEAHFNNKIRPDSRSLNTFRPILLNINCVGTATSSACLRIGQTSVMCGIKAELANPSLDAPESGFFVPNVTMTSLCSNKILPGPPTEQPQVLSQMLYDLCKSSKFVDEKDLCIHSSQLSWCLSAEIVCLSNDGNVLDASLMALMAALKRTKLPKVLVDPENNSIEVGEEFEPLNVNRILSVTSAVFGDVVVVDPTAEEESLTSNFVTVFIKEDSTTSVHSQGRVTEDQLFQCISNSKKRSKEIIDVLESCN